MKTFITLFLICASFCLNAQTNSNLALVSTRGTATVYASPDEVLMSFSINTQADDLVSARKENAKLSSEAITYLKGAGLAAKHIQTRYLNVGIRYHNHRDKDNTRYYEATQSFTICITDMEKYENIVMGLLELGIDNIGSPTFRSTKVREHKDEARRLAIIAAREKAEMLAIELGQEIGSAHTISEVTFAGWGSTNLNAYSNSTQESSNQGSADSEAGFAQGQLEIKASIDVSFDLQKN